MIFPDVVHYTGQCGAYVEVWTRQFLNNSFPIVKGLEEVRRKSLYLGEWVIPRERIGVVKKKKILLSLCEEIK